ncbi:MAG: 4-hydroxy-tetrahydrodipicolinate synthase [Candidatus Cloacimonetes bacterium]|nr:4-hydroxy-tetrahydrodipicolinate synthase [Candidatus Cloacimonadota bacterium]
MLQGSIPALVTPFKNNEIDYNSLDKLLNFHLENKSDGLVLLGTTGEAPAISSSEKEELLKFCVSRVKGKIPLISGTGTNNFMQTVENTKQAEKCGIEYSLVVTPYYNKPNQEGLYLYYSQLAKQTNLPIIIYNVPSRTGCNIAAETVIMLSEEFPKQIVAIKEASGDITKASKIIRDTEESFVLLSGEDALNYPLLCVGSKGSISVTANCVPLEMHNLHKFTNEGKCEKALQIHQALIELNEMLFCDTNPIPVKHIMAFLGLIELEFRLPLCLTTEDKREKIISTFQKFKASNK